MHRSPYVHEVGQTRRIHRQTYAPCEVDHTPPMPGYPHVGLRTFVDMD